MKRIILIITLVFVACCTYAQKIKKEGNTFSAVAVKKTAKDSTKTIYTWKDNKGNVYPIYLTSSGAAYVPRVSKKTGKYYRQYLPKEVKEAINKNKK